MNTYLVIDDEAIIREGIPSLIHWEDEGFQLVGTAADGRDGLKKTLTLQPDLVLVDIKMPGMDGLEMIRRARDAGFRGEFIILTAHSKFEYARTAISFGVGQYLLKPIDEDELLKIVRTIRTRIAERDHMRKTDEDYGRLRFIHGLRAVLLKVKLEDDPMKDRIDAYFREHGGFACVVLVQDTMTLPGNAHTEFEGMMADRPPLHGSEHIGFMLEWTYVQIVFGRTYSEVKHLLKERVTLADNVGSFPMAVGHNISHWEDLAYSYEIAQLLLSRRFVFEEGEILSYDLLLEAEATQPAIDTRTLVDAIYFADRSKIQEIMYQLRNNARYAFLTEHQVRQNLKELTLYITNSVKEAEMQDLKALNTALTEAAYLTDLLDELHAWLWAVSVAVQKGVQSSSGGSATVVEQVRYYVKHNYAADLSLDLMAEKLNYNSNYLGRLFRQTIGHSFSQELDRVRLEAATQLLETSDLKIYEIAEQTGFTNQDIFYRKFRSVYGHTPNSYRQAAITEEKSRQSE